MLLDPQAVKRVTDQCDLTFQITIITVLTRFLRKIRAILARCCPLLFKSGPQCCVLFTTLTKTARRLVDKLGIGGNFIETCQSLYSMVKVYGHSMVGSQVFSVLVSQEV